MENVLTINGLSKHFGALKAVNQLSLNIPKGSIYGILGPNGSGKTTTLGMLLGVIGPTTGNFSWFGMPAGHEARKRIGAILEGPLFYPYLSGRNNLKVVADIKGMPYTKIDPMLKLVGLLNRKDSAFKTYSLGMKQRLAIAAALLNDPEVLILDEPTNGLDPQGIAEIRQLIPMISAQGVTILLASHLLDEVEKVCSHVAVLKTGNLLYSGSVTGLNPSGGGLLELKSGDLPRLIAVVEQLPGIVSVEQNEGLVLANFSEEPDPSVINQYLHQQGIVLSHLALRTSTLEEQFLQLTQ
ncbi:MAG: ATP-binding cassette domain-containing protein [Bacteroidota bacterium]